MAESGELARILARRRQLASESDLLRQEIAGELSNLESVSTWVEKGYSMATSFRTWWPVGAAALGIFLGRKGGRGFSKLGKLGKLWSLWKVVRQGMQLWRQYFAHSRAEPEKH